MNVGFLGGTGPEALGLALRLSRAGVGVVLGSRSLERAEQAAERCRDRLATTNVLGATNREMLSSSEIVFLTTPWDQAVDAVLAHRDSIRSGQILVDVTVPVRVTRGSVESIDLPEGSNAERIAHHLQNGVDLVGAFKTEPAHLLAELDRPLDCDTFVCGDSDSARSKVMQLAARIPGLRPLDAGPLAAARVLERMTVLTIHLNRKYGSRLGRFRVVGV